MLNNIEILSRVIIDDAFREAEAILEKAKREAESIKEKGINIANDLIKKNNINLSQVKLSNTSGKLISLAEFRARSDILRRKEEILKGALHHVQQEFFSIFERKDYPEILKKLIINALSYLKGEGSEFVCRVNSRDQSLLSAYIFTEIGKKAVPKKQILMLKVIMHFYHQACEIIKTHIPIYRLLELPVLNEIHRMKENIPNDDTEPFHLITDQIDKQMEEIEKECMAVL